MSPDEFDDVNYFVDENLLGFHKLLTRSGRTDAIAPGDLRCPSIPLGTPDLDWMPIANGRISSCSAVTGESRLDRQSSTSLDDSVFAQSGSVGNGTYGANIKLGDISCQVRKLYVRCFNERGRGFTLSRQSFTRY